MENNKTALIVLPNDVLGGAEKKLKQIAIELSWNGFDVDVLFLKRQITGGWNDVSDKIKLHFTIFQKERFAIFTLPHRVRKASKNKVHFTFSSNTGLNGILGILRRLKLLKTDYLVVRESTQLLDRYGGLKGMIFRKLYTWGYPHTDLVICQTAYMQERLLAHMPLGKAWNLHVIPNPTNSKEVKEKATQEIEYQKYGKYILGVGRLIHLKGFDLLIESLNHINKDYNLVLVGNGKDEETLRQVTKEHNLERRVFFAGYQQNPYPYMRHAEVCVISSRIEGFPNTLLQMMSVNERVVSTLCAGDIDKLDGVLTCPTNDVSSLSNAIKCAIELSDVEIRENREKFDKELDARTINQFLAQIKSNIVEYREDIP